MNAKTSPILQQLGVSAFQRRPSPGGRTLLRLGKPSQREMLAAQVHRFVSRETLRCWPINSYFTADYLFLSPANHDAPE